MKTIRLNSFRFHFLFVLFILAELCLSGCDIKKNKIGPGNNFARIYDNKNTDGSFDPLDIKQTSDDGYLILAAADGFQTYLMKVDKEGAFLWEQKIESPYVNPVANLFQIGSAYYFFCMDIFSLSTYLMKVDESGGAPTEIKLFDETKYPLHASAVPDGFLVEGYIADDYASTLTKIDNNFNKVWLKKYDAEDYATEKVINHVHRKNTALPFFTGYVQNQNINYYYLNAFYQTHLSLLFVNPADGKQLVTIGGDKINTAINSFINLGSEYFALSRFSEASTFFNPRININFSQSNISNASLEGKRYNEFEDHSPVKVKGVNIGGKPVIIYASESRSNNIALLCYDETSGNFLGSNYLGHTYPYKIGNITQTSDGAIAVLGKTFVAGRYERICLFKLSVEETNKLAGQ